MKLLIAASLAIAMAACEQPAKETKAKNMNLNTDKQNGEVFSKGKRITNDNFTGTAFLNSLVEADSTNEIAVGSVTFEPGARTNWHSHPAGQIILVIGGEGYYQEEGSPKKNLYKGDVVKCPPSVPHWHGASANEALIQVAITSREKGPTQWMKPVTDEEYNSIK